MFYNVSCSVTVLHNYIHDNGMQDFQKSDSFLNQLTKCVLLFVSYNQYKYICTFVTAVDLLQKMKIFNNASMYAKK